MEIDDWKKELSEIVFAQFRVICGVALLVTIGAILIACLWPPTYEASGRVIMLWKNDNADPSLLGRNDPRRSEIAKEDVVAEMEILTSPGLIAEALRSIERKKGASGEVPPDRIAEIRGAIGTQVVPFSHITIITLRGRRAAETEQTLEAILECYLTYRAKVLSPAREGTFLEEQAAAYEDQLKQIEAMMITLAKDANAVMPEREIGNNIDTKRDLARQIIAAREAVATLTKQIEPIAEAIAGKEVQYFAFLENRTVSDVAVQLMNLRKERDSMLRVYSPESLKAKQITRDVLAVYLQLHKEAQGLLDVRHAEIAALTAQILELQSSSASLDRRNIELQQFQIELDRLARQAGVLRSAQETFARRAEEARINTSIAASTLSGGASILRHASNSAKLVFPRPLPTILFGVIAGIMVGVALGFMCEFLDHRIKRPTDVLRYTDLSVLGSIRDAKVEGGDRGARRPDRQSQVKSSV